MSKDFGLRQVQPWWPDLRPLKSRYYITHKKSLSWYVCCMQATFFRLFTHRSGILDSGNNYTNTLAIQPTHKHKTNSIRSSFIFYYMFRSHVLINIGYKNTSTEGKVLRIFLFCNAFPPVPVLCLMTVDMYDKICTGEKNKRVEFVCCVFAGCIASDWVTQRDDDMMISKHKSHSSLFISSITTLHNAVLTHRI